MGVILPGAVPVENKSLRGPAGVVLAQVVVFDGVARKAGRKKPRPDRVQSDPFSTPAKPPAFMGSPLLHRGQAVVHRQ